ncbi:hypothetical protein [Cellulosimicrobium sp. Marseille-Q4280]|uniref:hypothetical protein n=1 Tax=Cellulosimicrobium sp. Marseille-Q4280 TaxID=2937992 RepID=UPI00203C6746|nr:hypothetical protein [Cellulosimicrobium sp. Marseille-Q4280]
MIAVAMFIYLIIAALWALTWVIVAIATRVLAARRARAGADASEVARTRRMASYAFTLTLVSIGWPVLAVVLARIALVQVAESSLLDEAEAAEAVRA